MIATTRRSALVGLLLAGVVVSAAAASSVLEIRSEALEAGQTIWSWLARPGGPRAVVVAQTPDSVQYRVSGWSAPTIVRGATLVGYHVRAVPAGGPHPARAWETTGTTLAARTIDVWVPRDTVSRVWAFSVRARTTPPLAEDRAPWGPATSVTVEADMFVGPPGAPNVVPIVSGAEDADSLTVLPQQMALTVDAATMAPRDSVRLVAFAWWTGEDGEAVPTVCGELADGRQGWIEVTSMRVVEVDSTYTTAAWDWPQQARLIERPCSVEWDYDMTYVTVRPATAGLADPPSIRQTESGCRTWRLFGRALATTCRREIEVGWPG